MLAQPEMDDLQTPLAKTHVLETYEGIHCTTAISSDDPVAGILWPEGSFDLFVTTLGTDAIPVLSS
ncbi:MAG: hypothetical protein WC243_02630 [Patescibacteria group bacterium]|jgi:hypothetical protein